MSRQVEYPAVFAFGAVAYSLIEIIFRGFTHWTMTITGGIACVLFYITTLRMKTKSFFLRCLAGCAIITALELIVGCIVNLRLGMNVWDYSGRPGHISGKSALCSRSFGFCCASPSRFS